MDTRNIWGKVILYLRERKKIATHIACGDITDIEIKNGKLIIKHTDEFLINVIKENVKDIENALSWQGVNLEVEIVKVEKELSIFEKNLSKIKDFAGDLLEVIDEGDKNGI